MGDSTGFQIDYTSWVRVAHRTQIDHAGLFGEGDDG